jgi:hypothetical protein
VLRSVLDGINADGLARSRPRDEGAIGLLHDQGDPAVVVALFPDDEAASREAEEIRAYVSAVRERQAALDEPLSATGFQQWADWALSQADRIDPVLAGSFRTVQDDD